MPYACDLCDKVFTYSSILKLHYRSHTGEKPFQCKFCKKLYSHEAYLIVHSQIHAQNEECFRELSNEELPQKAALEEHKELLKDERKGECCMMEDVLVENYQTVSINQDKSHTSFKDEACLIEDFLVETRQNVIINQKATLEEHKELLKDERKGESCMMEDVLVENYQNVTINQDKSHTSFISNGEFSKERPIIHFLACKDENSLLNDNNNCDKTLSEKSELSVRYSVRKKPRTFICDSCGEKFLKEEDFQMHKLLHIIEKPLECDLCEKSFSGTEELNIHRQVHIKEELFIGENVSIKIEPSLKCAVRANTEPFKCELCGRSFSRKDKLVLHHRTHMKEKNFKCDFCGRFFSRQDKLKLHQPTHTKEKPFMCNTCGRVFLGKEKLISHLRIHKKTEPLSEMKALKCLCFSRT